MRVCLCLRLCVLRGGGATVTTVCGVCPCQQSRETFSSLGYTKAVGLCDNNSGVAYTLLGDHSKAAGCFQTAVLSSEELLSCQSPTNPRYADHKAQVGGVVAP